MAWLNSAWRSRAAITLYSSSDLAQDFDVVIPSQWDDFWDNIDTSGNELRVTDAAGTALDYGIDDGSGGAFSKTNRLGRIRINNYDTPISTSGATLAWIYYNSTSTQGSGAGSSGTGGQTGYIELATPSGLIIGHRSPIAGNTAPPQQIHKTAAERKALWLGYGGLLAPAFTPLRGASVNEELYYVAHDVVDTSAASVPTMVETTAIRFVWVPRGPNMGTWCRFLVVGGSSGNWYTSTLLSRTVSPTDGVSTIRNTFDTRIGVYVRDVRKT